MTLGLSAGSNHVGPRVTATANLIWDGVCAAARGACVASAPGATRRASANTRGTLRESARGDPSGLSAGRGCRFAGSPFDILEGAKAAGRPKGSVMTVAFELDGQEFTALNGGPIFKFTEAISFVVNCETQKEVAHFWTKLSAGGQEIQCGWLKDRFGVAWQVVPTVLVEMLQDKDREKSRRVMAAMLKMNKIDIAGLKKAYAGALYNASA